MVAHSQIVTLQETAFHIEKLLVDTHLQSTGYRGQRAKLN